MKATGDAAARSAPRRGRAWPLLVAMVGLSACTTHPPTADEGAGRPNIVFIMADDHATQAVGCYGSRINRTPQIDRLARGGVRFDRAFCTNGICGPARATVLTGKYSHRNGVLDNSRWFDGRQMTLPKLLRSSGYRTALIGKWHLGSTPTGFDRWMVLPGQGHYYQPDVIEGNLGGETGRRRLSGYVTDLVTDEALRWIDAVGDRSQPFFLMLHHKAPHRNWMPALRHLDRYRDADVPEPPTLFDDHAKRGTAARQQEMTIADHLDEVSDLKARDLDTVLARMTPEQRTRLRAAYREENRRHPQPAAGRARVKWRYQRYLKEYLSCIDAVDESIGRVLEHLDAAGLAENTLVVYTSDQGFFLGERGWFDKRFMYEEALRMPLIMRWPKGGAGGIAADALAANVDLAPTLLDVAGVRVPDDMQGRSLRPILETGRAPDAWRDAVYYHFFEYPGIHAVKRHYGVRTARHKLIHFYHDVDEWELYDLERDPEERRNVHDDPAYADIRDGLRVKLRDLQSEYGDDPARFRASLAPRPIEHDAVGLPVVWKHPPVEKYARDAGTRATDGQHRPLDQYAPRGFNDWLGFRDQPVVGTLSFPEPRALAEVAIHFRHDPAAWIHLPMAVELHASTDGQTFARVTRRTLASPGTDPTTRLVSLDPPDDPVRALRFVATPSASIPRPYPGVGHPPWTFLDEWVVRTR